jgi:hypothetical protein
VVDIIGYGKILVDLNLTTCLLPHQVEQMVTYTLMIDNFKLQVKLSQ